MSHRVDRDIDKIYPRQEFVAKLRRLADALETEKRFEISIGGERIEFQLRWRNEAAGDENASGR